MVKKFKEENYKDYENKKRTWESSTSILNYFFVPFYLLISKLANRFKINLSSEFYIFLSLLIVLLMIYLGSVSLTSMILVIPFILIFEFLSLNLEVFMKFFSKEHKIREFINNLDKKDTGEVIIFIEKNFLETEEIINIFESKHGKYEEIHKAIWSKNNASNELLKYIVLNFEKLEIDQKRVGLFILNSEKYFDNGLVNIIQKSKNYYFIGALNVRLFSSDKINLNSIKRFFYMLLNFISKLSNPGINILLSLFLISFCTFYSLENFNINNESSITVFIIYLAFFSWFLITSIIKYIFRGIKIVILIISKKIN